MSAWDQFTDWLQSLFQPKKREEPAAALAPHVLLITFDPVIASAGGRKLSQVLGWGNVDELCRQCIADLRECSNGFVDFQIVQRIEVDAWPVKEDGFRYDGETYLRNSRTHSGWHTPDTADYEAIIAEFDLLKRVSSGQIDEVWMFGFPFAGFFESRMVGPEAVWCNAPPMVRSDVGRRFVIMGFSYERGVGEMLENFGHRAESHLRHVWRNVQGNENLWERFILYDKIAPGKAQCGWMHYAPNSVRDYDWGNRTKVPSGCDDWLHFPDLQGRVRVVDCSEWGGGEIRAHHKWWFKHLPHVAGQTHGIINDWWWYAIDPNAVH
jgi:hypothetical protein